MFDAPSNVRGYVDRNGRIVAPHTSRRKRKMIVLSLKDHLEDQSPPKIEAVNEKTSSDNGATEPTPDFSNPKTFEDYPSLASLARRAAERAWNDLPPLSISRGDFKREVLAGRHPDVVQKYYQQKMAVDTKDLTSTDQVIAAEQAKENASAPSKTESPIIVTPPEGYKLTQEGSNLILSGKFDQDIHARIKRAGGIWSGVTNGNRRVWIIPASKISSLSRIFSNSAKKKASEAEDAAIKKAEEEKALAEDRKKAPEVSPGKYGPFSVTSTPDGTGYRVSFPYDPSAVDAIKKAGGKKYNAVNKTWFIDRADGERLQRILNAAVSEHEKMLPATKKDAEKKASQTSMRALFSLSFMPIIGSPVMMNGRLVVFTGRGEQSIIDDGHPSIWPHLHGEEGKSGMYVNYRAATQKEAEAYAKQKREAESKAAAKGAKLAAIDAYKKEIMETGERPPGRQFVTGEKLHDSTNIYGGGDYFVIGDNSIWYIRNNGGDGDDWSHNNINTGGAGGIGWRVPYSDRIAQGIRTSSYVSVGSASNEVDTILERAIPGLNEYENASKKYANAVAAYDAASERGYPSREAAAASLADAELKEIMSKFPATALWRRVQIYLSSSNYQKMAAGKEADRAIRAGAPIEEAVKNMESQWLASARRGVLDS